MSNKSKKEAFFKTFLFLIFLVLVLLLIDVDKISNIFENSNDGTSQTAEFRGLYPFFIHSCQFDFSDLGGEWGKHRGCFIHRDFENEQKVKDGHLWSQCLLYCAMAGYYYAGLHEMKCACISLGSSMLIS